MSQSGAEITMEITQQLKLRHYVIYDMFVETAEQNYVVARWCIQQQLDLDFLWNAAHCLEKMMKAVLLLNGRSSIKTPQNLSRYGHDLSKLFPEVKVLAGYLLPDQLTKPSGSDMHWVLEDEPADVFINRISENGNSHNRYHIYGHALYREDLLKFDRMVFEIRRLCCPLDCYMIHNEEQKKPKITYRKQLESDPNYIPKMHKTRWEKITEHNAPEELRHAALNQNQCFAPDYNHKHQTGGFSGRTSVARFILREVEQSASGERAANFVELIEWVVENIALPKEVKELLMEARDSLDARI